MRQCTTCRKTKPADAFYAHASYKKALHPMCRECTSVQRRAYYLRNREKLLDYAAKQRERSSSTPASRAKAAAYTRQYREKNRDRMRAYQRLYHTGWTHEGFEAAWSKQKGRCAMTDCRRDLAREGCLGHSVAADHAPGAGGSKLPRALLCANCNKLLGVYERRHRAFAQYLSRFQ